MQEITFDLQTITPLFLAGANYKSIPIPPKRQQGSTDGWDLQAEIRPASFRGLMRYWFRAAAGGLVDTTISIKNVTQFEESIFGSTEHRSAINIRIADISKKAEQFKKDQESYFQATVTGKDYLFWSMADSGKGQNYKPNRWYFPEGTHFKVVLSECITDPATPQTLPYAIASMWLLTFLGGIGSRSHRCAGSLAIQQVTGSSTNLPFSEATNKEELQVNLREGILAIHSLNTSHLQKLKKIGEEKPLTNTPFDRLLLLHTGGSYSSPHFCRVWILTQNNGLPWQSSKDAMNMIGTALKVYRSSLTSTERATFGLPLNMGQSDRGLENALKDNRRTSPLLLRITRLHGGGYVGIAVLFKTPTEPILDPRSKQILIPAPDYRLIENWVTTIFPRALEVLL